MAFPGTPPVPHSQPENLWVSLVVLGGRYGHSVADLISLLCCSFQQRHLSSFLQRTTWGWGRRLGIVYQQPNSTGWCSFSLLTLVTLFTEEGGQGGWEKSRAFAPPLFTHPPLAPICSFDVFISGTRVGQCSAIISPDRGFERKSLWFQCKSYCQRDAWGRG